MEKRIRLRFVGLVIFAVRIIGAFTGLAFTMLVVRRLSVTDLGTWQWIGRVIGYTLIPAVIMGFWITRFVARDYSNSRTGLLLNCLLSVPALIVYIILIPILAGAVQATVFPFIVAAAFVPLYYLTTTLTSISGGIEPQNVGYSEIIFEISKVLLALVLVFVLQFALIGTILSVEIALVVMSIALLALTRKYLRGRFKGDVAKRWFSYSWLSAYISQSTTILSFDIVIVVALAGLQATTVLAYFTVALAVSAMIGIAGGLATGLHPKLLKGGEASDIEVVLKLVLLFGIPMLVGVLVLAEPLVYLFGPAYVVAVPIARLLVFSTFLDLISNVADFVLTSTVDVDKGKPRFRQLAKSRLFLLPSINLAMGIFYLATLFVLLATSSVALLDPVQICLLWAVPLLFAKSLLVVLKFWLSRKVMRFRIPQKTTAKYSFAALVMAIVLILCLPLVNYASSIYQFLVYPLILIGIGSATYLIIISLIDKEFRQLAKAVLRLKRSPMGR